MLIAPSPSSPGCHMPHRLGGLRKVTMAALTCDDFQLCSGLVQDIAKMFRIPKFDFVKIDIEGACGCALDVQLLNQRCLGVCRCGAQLTFSTCTKRKQHDPRPCRRRRGPCVCTRC